ncbi:MAG: nuclear transport factor 2 family protein [Halolamina sp.]
MTDAADGDRTAVVRRYYEAIDGDDYDALRALVADEFVHDRPDRTVDGGEAFVRFMRERRPLSDTTHVVDAVLVARDAPEAAAHGRLCAADGEELFAFVDVFGFDADGDVASLRTFTR